MDTVQDERRRSRRLSVRIPISTRPARSALPDRHADLLNISETGAYFVTWNRYAEGDLLDVSAKITTRDSQCLEWRYLARVKRVDGLDSRPLSYGVAVQFESDIPSEIEGLRARRRGRRERRQIARSGCGL
jgi:hypothetical protein